jgi:hypothetical protein
MNFGMHLSEYFEKTILSKLPEEIRDYICSIKDNDIIDVFINMYKIKDIKYLYAIDVEKHRYEYINSLKEDELLDQKNMFLAIIDKIMTSHKTLEDINNDENNDPNNDSNIDSNKKDICSEQNKFSDIENNLLLSNSIRQNNKILLESIEKIMSENSKQLKLITDQVSNRLEKKIVISFKDDPSLYDDNSDDPDDCNETVKHNKKITYCNTEDIKEDINKNIDKNRSMKRFQETSTTVATVATPINSHNLAQQPDYIKNLFEIDINNCEYSSELIIDTVIKVIDDVFKTSNRNLLYNYRLNSNSSIKSGQTPLIDISNKNNMILMLAIERTYRWNKDIKIIEYKNLHNREYSNISIQSGNILEIILEIINITGLIYDYINKLEYNYNLDYTEKKYKEKFSTDIIETLNISNNRGSTSYRTVKFKRYNFKLKYYEYKLELAKKILKLLFVYPKILNIQHHSGYVIHNFTEYINSMLNKLINANSENSHMEKVDNVRAYFHEIELEEINETSIKTKRLIQALFEYKYNGFEPIDQVN